MVYLQGYSIVLGSLSHFLHLSIIVQLALAMSSSVDQTNSKEILTEKDIMANLGKLLDCLSQVKQSVTQCSSSSSNNSSGDDMHIQFEIIRRDLEQIKESFKKFSKFEEDAGGPIKELQRSLDEISDVVKQYPNDFSVVDKVKPKLSAFKDDAMKLKMKFPLWQHRMSSTSSDVHRSSWPRNGSNSEDEELDCLHVSHNFLSSSLFTEFQEAFQDLDARSKPCLLSFAVLPANVVVKRKLLINWWVGECLLDPLSTGEKTAEDIADVILRELEVKGFIVPVKERNKPVANRFRMQPLVHGVVIILARGAKFLDYDSGGNPTVFSSRCNRACLVKAKDGSSKQVLDPDLDLEKLQTIFNVNEHFPDLRFEWSAKKKKVSILEWFSRMKNLNVLYLGRWQSSDQLLIEKKKSYKNHIEVESTEFLKGLKNMKYLRLLSLQGISRINELPNSIDKLKNLIILDLKACHNLEALPDGIGSLKKLLHLDISECFLLDHMPKGLAYLSELQVLKGFVVGNLASDSDNNHQGQLQKNRESCALEDLIELKKLSKLSINTSRKAFPTGKELKALRKMETLQKLAIAWGVNSKQQENGVPRAEGAVNSDDNGMQDSGTAQSTRADSGTAQPARADSGTAQPIQLNSQQHHHQTQERPTKLKKLELQCFPDSVTPYWLMPGSLKSLEKLYIRGGKLINLGKIKEGDDSWTVKSLRLKYLDEFTMNWNELQKSFPHLNFLENFKCPKLKLKVDNTKILYVSDQMP